MTHDEDSREKRAMDENARLDMLKIERKLQLTARATMDSLGNVFLYTKLDRGLWYLGTLYRNGQY